MTTKEFIKYASERPELCEKLSACTAPEEAYDIAKEKGLNDDMATFTEEMAATKKEMEALSDKDLTQVNAAGTTTTSLCAASAAGVLTATTATLASAV